jgi:sulfur transfer protein SufE
LLASWPSDVWSDDARIVMGLAALVSAGIIDETRSAEIVAK